MRPRVLVAVTAAMLVCTFAFVTSAQQTRPRGGMMRRPRSGMHGAMMSDSMMMKGMGCTMMGMWMPRMVVPVADGIIVVVGDKLIKYDKNLKKKQEVTIDIDVDELQKRMEKYRQLCPMGQGPVEEEEMETEDKSE